MNATATRKRIALFGLFGMNNLGNDATLRVTLHHLRLRQPETEVVCVCANPGDVSKAFEIPAVDFDPMPVRGIGRIPGRRLRNRILPFALMATEPLRMRRVMDHLAGADQLLIVGTGALDDFGASPWNSPAWLFRWCRGAKRVGASLKFVAVGAGPIHNTVNRFLMTRAVRMSDGRSYRDKVSRDFLGRLGIDVSSDPVVPDLAFGLPYDQARMDASIGTGPRTIGVGLMGYFGWSADATRGRETYQQYIGKMTRFVRWLLSKGYDVRLLIGEIPTDDEAVRDVKNAGAAAGDVAGRLFAERITSLDTLLSEIARTDLVVASRYHNVVFALALGRPVVSVGYAAKFNALMGDVGMSAYCQDLEKLDVDRLMAQFEELSRRHAEAAETIRSRTEKFRCEVDALYDSLFGPVSRARVA
jgi:polysaccharide pyruvyl transferase WcaK-like protein